MAKKCYLCGNDYPREQVKKTATLLGEIDICDNCQREVDQEPEPKPMVKVKKETI